MADKLKVINGLKCCMPMTTRNGFADCKKCPYDRKITLDGGITECCHDLMVDALVLLEAQEPVKPLKMEVEHVRKEPVVFSYECPVCMCGLQRHWVACPICGTGVKWDAQEQRDYEAAVEMAEYCERYEPTYNADDGSM